MLTDREKAILDFEGLWWRYAGGKENAIRDQFNVTAVRYYQTLTQLVARPEAVEYAPMTVNRLRRIAESRARRGASAEVRKYMP